MTTTPIRCLIADDEPLMRERLRELLAAHAQDFALVAEASHGGEALALAGAEAAARAGVGLMLAGHTHGGQLWPLSLLTRRVFPLTAGRYRVGGMTVLVSRGTGNWGPRMRLWRRAEIMLVVLKRATVTSNE